MKWLIIGAGWISADFIKALRNNNEEVFGLYSRTKSKALQFAKDNKVDKVFDSIDEAFEGVDAVYIATPNIFHYEFAKKAILANKHVMIEKPITHSYELTKELYELANLKKVRIMEAYAHITNLDKDLWTGNITTNYMSVSSKIKNNTYTSASTFSKKMFGGAAADIGVYPISLAIMKLGKVNAINLSNIEYLNGVDVDFKIKLVHERGDSTFRVSKVKDGDNSVFLNGNKILDNTNFGHIKNRMNQEVLLFKENKDLDYWKDISIEVSRVLEIIENQFK